MGGGDSFQPPRCDLLIMQRTNTCLLHPSTYFPSSINKKSRDNSRENDQNLWKKKKRTRLPSFSPLNLCTNNRLLLLLFPFCLPLASNISIFSQIRIVLTGFQTKVQYYLILLLPEKQFQDCNYKFYTCAKNRTRTLTHSRLIWITKHIHKLLPADWFRETCKEMRNRVGPINSHL